MERKTVTTTEKKGHHNFKKIKCNISLKTLLMEITQILKKIFLKNTFKFRGNAKKDEINKIKNKSRLR